MDRFGGDIESFRPLVESGWTQEQATDIMFGRGAWAAKKPYEPPTLPTVIPTAPIPTIQPEPGRVEVMEMGFTALLPWLMGLIGGGGFLGGAASMLTGLMDQESGYPDVGAYGWETGQGGARMSTGTDVDLYGRSGVVRNGGGVPVGGPGVPEPPAAMVSKHWQITAYSPKAAFLGLGGSFNVHFFALVDGRVMSFNPLKNQWKMWRPKKPIVLYRGKITLSKAIHVQKMLDRVWKGVAKNTKALQMAHTHSKK